jgi:hypothetical protein
MQASSSYFCFPEGSDLKRTLLSVLDKGIGFTPTFIYCPGVARGRFKRNKHLALIEQSKTLETLRLADGPWNKSKESFELARIADWNLQEFWWTSSSTSTPSEEVIRAIISNPAFSFGFRDFDQERGSETPHLIPQVRLAAAWQMWFGPPSFKWVPKDRLLSCSFAHCIKTLGEIVFVQLYEHPSSETSTEKARIKKAFEKWISLEDILRRGREVRDKQPLDPHVEVERGQFGDGGTMKMIHWLTDDGKLTVRSKASQRLDIIVRPDGKEVARKISPAT